MAIKGLINKPQFDSDVFSVGHPVRLSRDASKCTVNSKTYTKFSDGNYGLIKSVSPLSIQILLVNNKIASIDVDDVSQGIVTIDILE